MQFDFRHPSLIVFDKIFCDCPIYSANTMKWVTIKMFVIIALGQVTAPMGFIFVQTMFVTPTSTFPFDTIFALFWFQAPLQPIFYIMAFSKQRQAFLQLFCSETLSVVTDCYSIQLKMRP